jgi:hypothetical protein
MLIRSLFMATLSSTLFVSKYEEEITAETLLRICR